MKKINLCTPEFTTRFAAAPIYAKKAVVKAIQLTEDGLRSDAYTHLDVRYDEDDGCYVVDTYVMIENDGVRKPKLENTREVTPGMWLVTNPIQVEGDRLNNYAMDGATFEKRYEPIGDGRYRARGMARIIQNNTGDAVQITPPWGGTQEGDADCYFCSIYDPANPEDISDNRYILSENDFAAYGPADEVLG